MISIVMCLNRHFGLHNDAFESRLIGIDRDAVWDALRAAISLQVVVVDARNGEILRLVTDAAVADVAVSIACVGQRRRRRLPRGFFGDRRQRRLVVQVRVLNVAVM